MTKKAIPIIIILLLGVVLRSYRLTQIPVALHGDEVGAGYNAYSLLKTGVDEYGKRWPWSFRENISPLNFYLMIPFVALLGPTDLAVRLPGVVWGTATILLSYLLIKSIFADLKYRISICRRHLSIAELSALLVAISPWHIQVSRIAHDANLGLLVQMAGIWLFIKGLTKPSRLIIALGLFGLSLYAYHAPKLTTPLMIAGLLWLYRRRINWQKARLGLAVFFLVSLPLVVLLLTTPLKANRLIGVSILVRQATLEPAMKQAEQLPKLARLVFYNPLVIYGRAFVRQYFNYLNWDWLFFDNSLTRYFNISQVGLIYLAELPFLLIGLYQLINSSQKETKLLLLWLLIGPMAGAATLGEPNGGRAILMLAALEPVAAWGIVTSRWLKPAVVGIFLGVNFIWFSQQYFIQAPQEYAVQWAWGSKQAAQLAAKHEEKVSRVIFTDRYKQPYIYVLFYAHQSPEWLQGQSKQRRENLGYRRIGKYEFRPVNWDADKGLANTLLIGSPEEIPETAANILEEIRAPNGQILWRAVKT